MLRSDVEQAIRTIQNSKTTHLKWIHYLNHPQSEPVSEDVGDIDHHTKTVEDYDQVLFVLTQLKGFLS